MPHHILILAFSGTLKVDELERIVIDGSHIDTKQRGIFDMKDTHLPLLKLLTRPEFKDRYGASKKKIQILMF
jgi:protein CMS1